MKTPDFYLPQYFLSRFCVVGINYRKAATIVRGTFSIDAQQYQQIIIKAKQKQISSLFVISTCNRTEIYGYVAAPNELAELLLEVTGADYTAFTDTSYSYYGISAVTHFFKVTSGLDSQIIGDYEIAGQVKAAVAFSRTHNMIGPVMDRTISFALQASKKIRTVTNISNGTVSVSYAAIEWLRTIPGISEKKIAVIGAGNFGKSVCKNILYYLGCKNITICNRTNQTAQQLAEETGMFFCTYKNLDRLINTSEVVVVCTHASKPTIWAASINCHHPRWFLDLSIPSNVEAGVATLKGQRVVNIDEISEILRQTIAKRKAAIPVAIAIVDDYLNQFINWLDIYQHSVNIKFIKEKLLHLNNKKAHNSSLGKAIPANESAVKVNRTVCKLAEDLRLKKEKGCQVIKAYNYFFNQYKDEE